MQRVAAAVLELEYTLIPHGMHVVGRAPSAVGANGPAAGDGRIDRRRRCRIALRSRRSSRARRLRTCSAATARQGRSPRCANWPTPTACWCRTASSTASCARSTAVTCDRRRAATCCARRRCCRPAATCTASTRSASRARSPSATAPASPSCCSTATWTTAHPLPESVALVLWGTDNLKTEGSPIGQALALLGAVPRFDSYGRLAGATLLSARGTRPAAHRRGHHAVGHLPRPAAAADQAAGRGRVPRRRADEPEEMNFVRKHALAYQASTAAISRARHCACSATPRAPTAPT